MSLLRKGANPAVVDHVNFFNIIYFLRRVDQPYFTALKTTI